MVPGLNDFLLRIKSLLRKKRLDREMAEELDFHQTLMREKLLHQGVPRSEANAAVRKTFGNSARWHERLRELWQFRSVENLTRDVTFSLRLLKKSPGFTIIALLTITLGVGANTAVFSLINSLLLRPLPVPHSDQLVVLGMDQGGPRTQYTFPAPFFRALEKKHELFQQAFASYFRDKLLVRGSSGNENVPGLLVSGDYFTALQTPPLLGRYLTPEDDKPGGSPEGLAAVISEQYWGTRFNRSPNAVGSKLQIANAAFTIVGVMPKRFIGADPTAKPQIFVPLASEPIIDAPSNLIESGYHGWWLVVMGRLQPGVSLDQLNAALKTMSSPILHDTVPEPAWIARAEKEHFHFIAVPGSKGFTYIRFVFEKPLVALFCMCGGILLLACLNLASLLVARAAARERELATRLALGASRRRLIQQLLVESLLVALMGTMLGLAIAPAVSHSLATMLLNRTGSDIYLDTSLDLRMFAFAALIAVVATLLIGLFPALQATSGNLNEQIKEGQHKATTHKRRLLQPSILALEVGLALILVIGAGLLATSMVRLFSSGAGFNPKGVVNIALDMDKQPLEGDALLRVYQQFGETMSHQPGVTTTSFSWIVPLTHTVWDDEHTRPGGVPHDLYLNAVAPDYFKAMSIPMYEGRDFRWTDTPSSGLKMIINQSAAKLFFPDRNPIGQHLLRGDKKIDFEIVGVVGDVKIEDLRTAPPAGGYVPVTQSYIDGGASNKKPSFTMVLRTTGSASPLAGAIRSLAARLTPDIPAPVVTTMDDVVDSSISTERVMALLSVFFAACALLVTGIGLYGTLAYSTARRTSEIGIRMALGAQRATVIALVFRTNAMVALVGAGAGFVAAILGSRALASFLYETSPHDPWVMLSALTSLIVIATAASLLPAIRAARIEPITAIRCE